MEVSVVGCSQTSLGRSELLSRKLGLCNSSQLWPKSSRNPNGRWKRGFLEVPLKSIRAEVPRSETVWGERSSGRTYATKSRQEARHIHKLKSKTLVSKMAEYEEEKATADPTSGKVVFEPILEEGIFIFDCSGNDRDRAFPSISFVDSKVRDTPLMIHQKPKYIPTFELKRGQQLISLELPAGTSFYGTGEISGQLERTGKYLHGTRMPVVMVKGLLPCISHIPGYYLFTDAE